MTIGLTARQGHQICKKRGVNNSWVDRWHTPWRHGEISVLLIYILDVPGSFFSVVHALYTTVLSVLRQVFPESSHFEKRRNADDYAIDECLLLTRLLLLTSTVSCLRFLVTCRFFWSSSTAVPSPGNFFFFFIGSQCTRTSFQFWTFKLNVPGALWANPEIWKLDHHPTRPALSIGLLYKYVKMLTKRLFKKTTNHSRQVMTMTNYSLFCQESADAAFIHHLSSLSGNFPSPCPSPRRKRKNLRAFPKPVVKVSRSSLVNWI